MFEQMDNGNINFVWFSLRVPSTGHRVACPAASCAAARAAVTGSPRAQPSPARRRAPPPPEGQRARRRSCSAAARHDSDIAPNE